MNISLALIASLVIFQAIKSSKSLERALPLMVFVGAYFSTVFIGAVLIGLPDNSYALNVLAYFNLDLSFLNQGSFDQGYWILLYMPLVIPPLVVWIGNKYLAQYHCFKFDRLNMPINFWPFIYALLGLLGFILISLRGVLNLNFLLSIINHLNYSETILSRMDFFANLGWIFFGLVYCSLPVFSLIALYQWQATKEKKWGAVFLILLLWTAVLYLDLFVKSALLVYLLAIALALYVTKIVNKLRIFLIFGLVSIAVVNFYQVAVMPGWGLTKSLDLMIFRMASSFPFYYKIYPQILPFTNQPGLGLLSSSVGLAPNEVVFNYMYPEVNWVQGTAPASAHMVAYAQGGFFFAFFISVVIGWIIFLVGKLATQLRGPLVFALYIQLLIALYYLTQTTLVDVLVSSYGIIWSLGAIIAVFLANLIFCSAMRIGRCTQL